MTFDPLSLAAQLKANRLNAASSNSKYIKSNTGFILPTVEEDRDASSVESEGGSRLTAEDLYRFNLLTAKTALDQIALLGMSASGDSNTGMDVVDGYSPLQMLNAARGTALPSQNTAALKAYSTSSNGSRSSAQAARRMAAQITSAYEGGGVTGNFDGQGVSLGVLQWNIGSGTLQPLLREMASQRESSERFDAIFAKTTESGQKMSDQLRQMLAGNAAQQMDFAQSINNSDNKIKEPWNTAFQTLLKDPAFEKIEEKYASGYIDKASAIMNDNQVGVKTVRGYALAFDIAVQNGGLKSQARKLVTEALSGGDNVLTNASDPSLTQNQKAVVEALQDRLAEAADSDTRKLYLTAAAVALTSNERYAKDVWARKSTIVAGEGTVHGRHFDFEASQGLSDQHIV